MEIDSIDDEIKQEERTVENSQRNKLQEKPDES